MDLEMIRQAITTLNGEVGAIEKSMGLMQINIAVLETKVTEIMWLIRGIVAATIVIAIRQLWKVMLRNHNKK